MDRNHAPPARPLSPASDCSMRSLTRSPTMEPTSKAKPPEKPFLPAPPKETKQEWERRKRKDQKMWMEAEDRPGLQKPLTQSEMQDIKRWNEEGRPPLTQSEIDESDEMINLAILTAQASADEAMHTRSSSMAPVDAPPESQQAHQQRLANLLHFRADRSNDILEGDIHKAPRKPVPPDCECCFPGAYACAACCALYPTL